MKNSKKLLIICLSVVLALSFVLAGCKKDDGGEPSPTSSNDGGGKENLMTITAFISRAGTNPTKDNRIYQKIKEAFNVEFRFEYVVGEIGERVGTMTAGGEYPDIIGVQSNEANQFIDAGAFIPLEKYINDKENFPNLNRHYGELINRIKHDDGHVYIMPNYGVHHGEHRQNENWGPAFWIQIAVLKEFGYPKIKTLDEYFDLIEKYVEKYPEIDGQKTIGFIVLTDRGRDWTLRNAPSHLAGAPNDGIVIVDQETKVAEVYQHKDISKRYFKKLNEAYNKGLVDPEGFVIDFDQYIQKLASGAVLGLFDQRWNFNKANEALHQQGKYDRMYMPVPIVFDESIRDWYLTRPELNVNSGFAITTSCKDPDRVMRLFEALLDEEWQKLLQWGEEGIDYLVDEDGMFYRNDQMRKEQQSPDWKLANKADDLFEFAPKLEGTYSDGNATSPGLQPIEYFEGLTEPEKELLTAYGVQTQGQLHSTPPENPLYFPAWSINIPTNSVPATVSQQMQDLAFEYLPQIIMAPTSEFESLWADFVKKHEELDIEAFEKHINEGIQRRMTEWAK
ncbi:MAG TPA: extracellular solute-binding protein [Acetivibrio saccincola]|uniref:extracellular solute-binding protein n=1 Tax=Acetivibrio saccincola TaxID=1677857 RepID=UPI002CC9A47B|nr:extracellular solute-binding protein [Acetivibrio saccincola]HOA96491.1 extracellular solute-binding protein [Acetivibrio saccincola]HQD28277.1 extracellular solute-binding protein [Acetivibrio saccincola]